MKRERFYLIIIILLVLVNFCALFFIMQGGKSRMGGNRFDERIERELNLNEDQREQFDEMKHRHHEQMQELDASMKVPFERYFSLLNSDGKIAERDSIENLISATYKKKVNITYDHFAELKSILNEEQKRNFVKLVPYLLQVITPQRGGDGNRPPPPPRFRE